LAIRKLSVVVATLLLSVACSSAAGPAAATAATQHHVFLIVMENHSAEEALGGTFTASLAAKYGVANNYHAVSHPSVPNYLALTSGNTWGVRDGTPSKMVIARSGSGEGMQIGGNVTLTVGDGTQARCVCRLGGAEWTRQACVCLLLRDLGLPRQAAAANTWSESMWADCSESVSCQR